MIRLHRASQVVTICRDGERIKTSKEAMNDVGLLVDASVVVDQSTGKIKAVGTEDELQKLEWYQNAKWVQDISMQGKTVMPGLVDGHTHPCWAGDRVHEFELKLAGATYMDVHKAGGGIGFTVRHTKEATEDELAKSLKIRLNRMLRSGTTLVEAKSGYGLELETEMKMLRVLHRVSREHAVEISSTYLGAHSIPKGKTAQEACKDIVENQIPELVKLKQKGDISPDNIDVFMEKGVFGREETREILAAGKAAGLAINFHGDELHPVGSAELGAELGARAISHLEEVSDEGIKKMAEKQIVGVLLPTTAYVLRIQPPPARKLIDTGVAVALGSDFNPNAHCMSMPFVMNLACVLMKMTVAESLNAATINAAASLNKSDLHGSIEVGKWANFLVLDHSDWRHLIYELVDPPIHSIWSRGKLVWQSQ